MGINKGINGVWAYKQPVIVRYQLAERESLESTLRNYYGHDSEVNTAKSLDELMDEAVSIDADRVQEIVKSAKEDSICRD